MNHPRGFAQWTDPERVSNVTTWLASHPTWFNRSNHVVRISSDFYGSCWFSQLPLPQASVFAAWISYPGTRFGTHRDPSGPIGTPGINAPAKWPKHPRRSSPWWCPSATADRWSQHPGVAGMAGLRSFRTPCWGPWSKVYHPLRVWWWRLRMGVSPATKARVDQHSQDDEQRISTPRLRPIHSYEILLEICLNLIKHHGWYLTSLCYIPIF